ncbi:717c99aa-a77d-45d4-a2e5-d50387bee89f [Thermothielavioides terrestris]|jgi:hypothetical protein
MYF